MDEVLARCVIDFSGRPYLVWRGMDSLAQAVVGHQREEEHPACSADGGSVGKGTIKSGRMI